MELIRSNYRNVTKYLRHLSVLQSREHCCLATDNKNGCCLDSFPKMVNDFVFSAPNVMMINEKGVITEVTNFHGV